MRLTIYAFILLLVSALAFGWWTQTNSAQNVLHVDCGPADTLFTFCQRQAAVFSATTGHEVEVLPSPSDPALHLAYLLELARARSSAVDVYLLDISWVGQLAPALRPLDFETKQLFSLPLTSNTVAGKLLAVPLTVDLGILYVNQPYLDRHNHKLPPTYRELDLAARYIRLREDAFVWGYAWPTEGDALSDWLVERLAADGAGTIIEQNGAITVLNQLPMRTLSDLQLWAGDLVPVRQTTDLETFWRSGQVLFMRTWATNYLQNPPAATTVMPLPQWGRPPRVPARWLAAGGKSSQ